jgi:putative hydrolase of the HAD superfamily
LTEISLLLWDVGGVVLSNAWDHSERAAAATHFHIEPVEFERRHEQVVEAFEAGRIDIGGYLSETVFHTARPFTQQTFFEFMCSRSREFTSTLGWARAISEAGKYEMVALNNESRELNEYRITKFHLREAFEVFLSSCYTGVRKPNDKAFEYALQLTQRKPEEVLFIDDRRENVDAATGLGIRGLWVRDPGKLRAELIAAGVRVP